MHEGVPREYKEQRARTRPEECDEDQKKVFKATRPEIGRESPERNCKEQKLRRFKIADPQTGVAPGWTRGRNMRSRYRCSMCSAIHINSRSWLRSSSTHEPSDPPLKVVFFFSSYREFARVLALKATIFFFSKMKKGNEALRAPGEAPEEGKGGHTFKKKGRLFEPRVAHEQRAELSTGDRIYLPTQVPKSFREVERGAVAAVKCNLSILTVPGSDRTTRQPLFEPNDPANSLPQQPRRAKGGAFAREEATSRHRGSFSSKRYPEKG